MSGNADTVRRAYGCIETHDTDTLLGLVAADFELDLSTNLFEPMVYSGSEGAERWVVDWAEVWQTSRVEIVELRELTDGRLLSVIDLENVGRESGAAVTTRYWQIWSLRDGLVTRVVNFSVEEAALRAAGPAE